jgi:methionyl-tRNA formyltransferase
VGGEAVRIFLLLVDEPFYTSGCLAPLLERWAPSIAGAGFPPGFFDWKRVKSSLRLYGIAGVAVRTLKAGFAAVRGGAVHRQLRQYGIRTMEVPDVNSTSFATVLMQLDVNLIVSLNCPQKLKTPLLSLPALGCINVHFGRLPRYRGILPIFHALLNGEASFGVTVHMMDERLDHGDILAQRDIPIRPGDTLETLYPQGFAAASELLDEVFAAFDEGRVVRRPNPASQMTYYSYPTKQQIREYYRLVRS